MIIRRPIPKATWVMRNLKRKMKTGSLLRSMHSGDVIKLQTHALVSL